MLTHYDYVTFVASARKEATGVVPVTESNVQPLCIRT